MTSEAVSGPESTVPRTIVSVLRSVIRRVRFVIGLRGVCVVATATLVALLIVMAIDRSIVILAQWPRWILSLWVLAVAIGSAVFFLIRPLAHSFTLPGIARALELRHPELHERISSAVELLASHDRPEVRGSEALIAALAEEASRDVRELRPSREVTFRAARPFLLAMAGALAIIIGLLAYWPDQTRRLLARAVAPFANLPNVAAYQLSVRPGDTVSLPDDAVRVELAVRNDRVNKAVLYRVTPDGQRVRSNMTRIADGEDGARRFTLTCPPARADYRYRVRAADALSRYYKVRVVPPPAVEGLTVRYDYPEYVGLEPRVVEGSDGEIEAVEGSRVTVTAALNKTVSKALLMVDDWEEPVAGGTVEDRDGRVACTFAFELMPGLDGSWRMEIADEHGFRNDQTEYPIRALPDTAPTVRVGHPKKRRIRCRPSDRLPVTYAAVDDFGLGNIELLLKPDDGKVRSRVLPLPEEDGGPPLGTSGRETLDFASREFEGVSKLEFQVAAQDRLPAEDDGPQEGLSRVFTVILQRDAPSYTSQLWQEIYREMSAGLQEVLEDLKAAKEQSAEARKSMAEESEEAAQKAMEKVNELSEHLTDADSTARELAAEMQPGPYQSVAERLEDVAEEHITPAGEAADEMKLNEDAEQRGELADEVDTHVDGAIAAIEEMQQDVEVLTEMGERLERLTELTEREKELAKALEEMREDAAQAAMSEEGWEEAQRGLTDEVGRLLKETPGGLQAQAAQDRQRLSDYAEEAKRLSEQQKSLAEDARHEGELAEVEKALDELAEKQKRLAEDTGGEKLTEDLKPPMSEAAGQIKQRELAEAQEGQKQAEQELRNRSDTLQREQKTEDLLPDTQKLAKEQRDLADKIQKLHDTVEQIDAAKKAKPQADRLAREQEQLARRAKNLEDNVAKNEAAAKHGKEKPSQQMNAAAQELKQGKAQEASAAAEKAAQQAQQLAKQLGEARKEKDAQGVDNLAREADRIADAQADLAKKMAELPEGLKEEFANPQATAQKKSEAIESARGLAEPQQALREQMEKARGEYNQATAEARKAFHERTPIWHTDQVTKSLQRGKLDDAASRAQESAERMEQAAEEVGEQAEQMEEVPDRPKKAEEIGNLAEQQEELRRELAELSERRERLRENLRDRQLEWLKAEQAEVAQEAAKLAYRAQSVSPQEDNLERNASRAAARASRQIESMEMHGAAESADQAAQNLGELAERFEQEAEARAEAALDEAAPDQESAAVRAEDTARHREIARQSAALAAREEAVAQGLEALAGEQHPAVTQAAQQEMTRRARTLQQGAQGVRDRLAQSFPEHRAHQQAAEGTERLEQAAEAAEQAEDFLGQEQPAEASPQQQQASDHLQAAARALEDAARQYDRAVAAAEAPDLAAAAAEDSQPLAAAYDDAHQAALSAQELDTALAAQRLEAARARATARAQRMDIAPFSLSQQSLPQMAMSQAADPKTGIKAVPAEQTVAKLQRAGIDLDDWGRLPSQLRNDILQAPEEKSPREYRELIRRYFREIARRGAEEPEGGEQEE